MYIVEISYYIIAPTFGDSRQLEEGIILTKLFFDNNFEYSTLYLDCINYEKHKKMSHASSIRQHYSYYVKKIS